MSVPDLPAPGRIPTVASQPWWWELLGAAGAPVAVPEDVSGLKFGSQADAETWIGLTWQELSDSGVVSVVLHEHERSVYGPMSLEA